MAISKITTKAITDGTIATADLADNAVNSAKIGADVIVAEDVANNAITVNEIQNGAVTSAKLDTNIAVSGTLGVTGALTAGSLAADGGVSIDNITIDGTEIDLSSGSLTVDSAGSITLDCGNGELLFNNAGNGNLLKVQGDSSNVNLISMVQDKDIRFKGNDGGSTITALTLDMSDAGAALFNNNITVGGQISLSGGTASSGDFTDGGIHFHDSSTSAGDVMPISFTPSASGNRARAAVGFISAQASGVDGFAGEIGFYTRDAADGTALGTSDERIRIDKSGLVGIGDSSPSSYNNYANNLVINNGGDSNGHVGMTIACATDKIGSIYFADGTTGNQAYRGALYYHHVHDRMYFLAGGGAAMYINSSGNVGIGTDQDAHGLTVYRHLQAYGGIMIQNGTNNTGQVFQAFHNYAGSRIGSISQNNSAVVYNTTSDYRLKENVSYTFDATSRLKQLKPARFNWISDDTNTTIDGFMAHEVSGIVPEAITGKKDGTQDLGTVKDADGNVIETNLSETFFTERKKETVDKDGNTEAAIYPSDYTWTKTGTENVYQGIDQAKLVPLLVKTIQELEARITALESA